MLNYILKRLGMGVLTVWFIATATFVAMHLVPGNPLAQEKAVNLVIRANLEKQYGLDKPVIEQYILYMKNMLHGDMGISYTQENRYVIDIIREHFPVSATLGLLSLFFATIGGVLFGAITAISRNRWPDHLIIVFVILGISVPNFVFAALGQLLILKLNAWAGFNVLPIAGWDSFSAMLIEDFGKELPGGARSYLDRICAASSRMGSLIDHLLELSRMSRTELKLEGINLSELAVHVLDMYQETDPQRCVETKVTESIRVLGDLSLMRLLLENLLGNAWKYTSKKPAARIEFGMTQVAGEEAFFVRDNGVGFDMAYEQKLFGIFERLHGTEFEGAGIGLATSQRIVKRHGGKIWAEGTVGEGATFYFSLPVFF